MTAEGWVEVPITDVLPGNVIRYQDPRGGAVITAQVGLLSVDPRGQVKVLFCGAGDLITQTDLWVERLIASPSSPALAPLPASLF